MTAKRKLSDEERDERREQDRQRLKSAAEQLLSSEGWQRWVRVRAQGGLARLSLNNQLLVALPRARERAQGGEGDSDRRADAGQGAREREARRGRRAAGAVQGGVGV
ncbi:MAG: hypothetical protein LC790_04870 [Actinobacteria bacterium]|nr:hypothetical protein [Actinomycetota bacterium]